LFYNIAETSDRPGKEDEGMDRGFHWGNAQDKIVPALMVIFGVLFL